LIPMLQQSMFSLKDTVTKASGNQDFYSFGVLQAISLVKIINDFKINEKNKKVRVVEGIEIPGFDYYTYMKNVSKNMPEWLKIRFVQKKLGGDYMIESGIALPFIPNKH